MDSTGGISGELRGWQLWIRIAGNFESESVATLDQNMQQFLPESYESVSGIVIPARNESEREGIDSVGTPFSDVGHILLLRS